MKYTAQGTVTGYTKFKGDIDGQSIDANTVFIEADIGQMGKGTRTVARRALNEDVIKKIEHLPFPVQAEIILEEQVTAKKEQLVVLEIRPVARVPKAA